MAKKIDLKSIFKSSVKIVDGLTFKLFATSLVYVDDIEDDKIDYLEPIERIDKLQIRDFFQDKLKKIIN